MQWRRVILVPCVYIRSVPGQYVHRFISGIPQDSNSVRVVLSSYINDLLHE